MKALSFRQSQPEPLESRDRREWRTLACVLEIEREELQDSDEVVCFPVSGDVRLPDRDARSPHHASKEIVASDIERRYGFHTRCAETSPLSRREPDGQLSNRDFFQRPVCKPARQPDQLTTPGVRNTS